VKTLKVQKLRKEIADFVLEADFEVREGERAVIVGRSGSGKTSLLRLISGLETPSDAQSSVSIGGVNILSLPPEKRNIGYVFQDDALFSTMNVIDNASFGLRMRGMGRKQRNDEATHWLKLVGLADRARDPIHILSGGEKQRIAFVRALIWKPDIVLLDEPFSSLDVQLRAAMRTQLLDLHKMHPAPMVMVTHDREDLAALATQEIRLSESTLEGKSVRRFS
jgi:ABC-type Fe3+/spermidine/putrescine transport system ATPase subunit